MKSHSVLPACFLLGTFLSALTACSGNDTTADVDSDLTDETPPDDSADADVPPPDADDGQPTLALDECGLDTGFPGDEACILPPPPDQGFQVHIGPDDYDNPDALYILEPSIEATTDFSTVSGNAEDIYFYYRQYRMRPTAHHMILSTPNGSALDLGRRIGTANHNQDFPIGGNIAEENQHVGMPLAAASTIDVSLHAINTTEDPGLREIWVNFWYRDAAEVTEVAEEWFKVGSISFAIQPYEETTLGPYTCDVPAEGRLLWLYGHRHANNERFTTWRIRGEQRDVIYEGLDWSEPLLLEYSSLIDNPAPDREAGVEGGWSGILDLLPGDRIEWECEVANQTDSVLTFSNQTYLGEMCIVDAEAVGTNCNGL